MLLYLEKSGILVEALLPMPLNGESKELVASSFELEVDSARIGREEIEHRGTVRRRVRELRDRDAIVKRVVVG